VFVMLFLKNIACAQFTSVSHILDVLSGRDEINEYDRFKNHTVSKKIEIIFKQSVNAWSQ
jgi:hypothetical protein